MSASVLAPSVGNASLAADPGDVVAVVPADLSDVLDGHLPPYGVGDGVVHLFLGALACGEGFAESGERVHAKHHATWGLHTPDTYATLKLHRTKEAAMIFVEGDRARYEGDALVSGECLSPGDIVTVHQGNEDPEDDVIVEFRGSYIAVSAFHLTWLDSGC